MKDDTYYQYLPMVHFYVQRWAAPDSILSGNIGEIYDDAKSYAYLYWMQVCNKFPQDETSATKYYVKTVKLKLDTYLNQFYRHQTWKLVDGENIRHTPLSIVSLDAPIDDKTTLRDQVILLGLPELVCHQEELDDTADPYVSILQQFLDEAEGPDKAIAEHCVSRTMQYLSDRPDSSSVNRRHGYDIPQLAKRLHMPAYRVNQRWIAYRKDYLARHPEVLAILHGRVER